MRGCWQLNSPERPSFGDLVRDIEEFLTELMNYFDPNAGDEPLPADPYMNWTQQLQAQAMEVEEQHDQEKRDLEIQTLSDQEAHWPEHIRGNDVDLIVNLDADHEISPRYHDSTVSLDVDHKISPRFHGSIPNLDVDHEMSPRYHHSTPSLDVDHEKEPRYHTSTGNLDVDHEMSPRYHDSADHKRMPLFHGSADNVGSLRYHNVHI